MILTHGGGLRFGVIASVVAVLMAAHPVRADPVKTFNIPAQDATTALPVFVQQSGLQVLASATDLKGMHTNEVKGALPVGAALNQLVAGTGLSVKANDGSAAVVVRMLTPVTPVALDPPASEPVAPEEIIVVGLRKSLRDALDDKRRSSGVAEMVSSKDIGALPDVTIAESLARLPGVNTTRDRGNDSQASIRGIGPRMVLGTVNGREVASSEPDRNIRWEIYPSEVVSGAAVYKTSEARLLSGGISGTVDIETIRPLDYRGPAVNLRAGAVYYDGGSAFPGYEGLGYRASGSWVKRLSPDFAFVLGATAQQQKNGFESFQGWGYNDDTLRASDSSGPITAGGPKVATPWGAEAEAKFLTSNRYSLSAGFQWKPVDGFELTYDLLYSKFLISEHQDQQWYDNNWGNWQGAATGGYANPVIVDGDLTGATTANTRVTSVVAQYNEDKDLIVTGLNGRWTQGAWTVSADLAWSRAQRSNLWRGVEAQAFPASMTWRLDGDPSVSVSQQPQDLAQNVALTFGQYSPGHLKDELTSTSLDLRRDLDGKAWTSLLFGLRLADRTKLDMSGQDGQVSPLPGVTALDPGLFTAYRFRHFSLPSMLDGNFAVLANAAYGPGAFDIDPKTLPFNSRVEEKVTEAYAEGLYASTFLGHPVDGNLGVRLVGVSSHSRGDSFSGGAWYQDPSGTWVYYPLVKSHAAGGRTYARVLPSFLARLQISSGAYLKFGLARVMSRPPLNELKANRTLSPIAPFTGTAGNPTLKPFEATQADLAYENYFTKDALFAVAAWYKHVDNYIGYAQRSETIDGNSYRLVSPVNSPTGGHIGGVELILQTPLTFIPGLEKFGPRLENFGIDANLALVGSNIHEFVPTGHPLPMNGLAARTANFDLWYAGPRIDARIGARYHSAYTAIYGWDTTVLARVEAETTLDASASYRLTPAISLRFQAGNLLDTPLRAYYDNRPDRLLRLDDYGRRFLFDVTVKY